MFLHYVIVLLWSPCAMPLLDGTSNLPSISELMVAVQQLNKTLDASRTEVQNLKTKVDNLTAENIKLKNSSNTEIQNLKLKVDKSYTDLRNLNASRTEIQNLKTKVDNLTAENIKLKNSSNTEIQNLKLKVDKSYTDLRNLNASRTEIQNLKTKVDNLTAENIKLKNSSNTEIQNLKLKVDKSYTDLRNLNTTLHTHSTVAFTARRLTSYDHLGDHQTIEFDRVITNIGNAYDPRQGHFVAPVKGVYHFTVDIFGWRGQTTIYDLVKNGDILCYPYSVKADDATQGTCSVTIELEVNDMIWVRFNRGDGGTRLYGSHNIFSGFLVTKL